MLSSNIEPARTVVEVDHDGYLQALRRAFGEAAARAELTERDLVVAGVRIRLSLAGGALAAALAPLRAAGASELPPDATIRIWDDASTGTRLPRFPWRPIDVGPQGAIAGWSTSRVRAVYHGSLSEPPHYGFNALSLIEADRADAFFWVAAPERVPWTEHVEPLRPTMHWTLGLHGRHLLHAAAIGTEGGAAVLAGAGFAGKTTTAMACVGAGLDFLGDNYVVLSHADGAPTVHCLYANIKLRAPSLALLPWLDRAELSAAGDRAVFDVADRRPAQVPRARRAKAVLVVRQSGGKTRVTQVSRAAAMVALAPSTIYQLPGNNGAALKPIADLLRDVPAYALELGPDPAAAPPVIAELLESL